MFTRLSFLQSLSNRASIPVSLVRSRAHQAINAAVPRGSSIVGRCLYHDQSTANAPLTMSHPAQGVAVVTLDRPEKLNALGKDFWVQCTTLFTELGDDPSVRAVVLCANGSSFCSGIDIKYLATAPPLTVKTDPARKAFLWKQLVTHMQQAFSAIESCPKPVIAAIHGYCFGAGVDMVTACDIRYAATDTKFSIKEVDLGIAADLGTLQRLPKVTGNDSLVRELALTAREFNEIEAFQMGMISKICKDVDETFSAALETATTIASKSPVAVAGTKINLNYSRDQTTSSGLDYVSTFNSAMLQTSDIELSFTSKNPEYPNLSESN